VSFGLRRTRPARAVLPGQPRAGRRERAHPHGGATPLLDVRRIRRWGAQQTHPRIAAGPRVGLALVASTRAPAHGWNRTRARRLALGINLPPASARRAASVAAAGS